MSREIPKISFSKLNDLKARILSIGSIEPGGQHPFLLTKDFEWTSRPRELILIKTNNFLTQAKITDRSGEIQEFDSELFFLEHGEKIRVAKSEFKRLDYVVFNISVEIKKKDICKIDLLGYHPIGLVFLENPYPIQLFKKIMKEFGKGEDQNYLSHQRLKMLIAEIVFSLRSTTRAWQKEKKKEHEEITRQYTNIFINGREVFEGNRTSNRSVKVIAEKVGVSRETLNKATKYSLGITMSEYIETSFMNSARLLIETTNEPIEKISRFCGQKSTSTFIRKFKELYGETPLQYRKKTDRLK